MGTALKAHVAWLVNALSISPNPLRRPIDRVAAGITLVLLMGALIAVPASAMFAGSLHQDLSDRAKAAAQQNRPVSAVLATEPALSVPVSEAYSQDAVSSTAVVKWRVGTQERSSTVRVPTEAKPGDTTTVWVNQQGNRVSPPADGGSLVASAVFAALLLLVILESLAFALIAATQHAARRIAMRAWGREWHYFQAGGSWSQA
ncbi:hypothetical protein GCM10009854_36470 [Saccharopolyspora halophila]|uniref:Transmembrane protein n=1 Tax=Saccharopolyspora halophila TaxID=405551 RepID=A0ABN3GLN6_9PSEU